jgi:phage minor structural protein
MAADTSNGLGRVDPTYCYIDEERNGLYDLTMEVSIDDAHYGDLANGSVLKVLAGHKAGLQLFRVYEMTKPMSGLVTVYAHHITYDLAKRPVLPFTATGAASAAAGLKSHIATVTDFDIWTDITNTSTTFTLEEPKYFRECLGGWRGSFLDCFGGEIEWDNLTVKVHANRGNDNGYHIRYGKNLVDLKQEENIENTFNSAIGYVTIDDRTVCSNVRYPSSYSGGYVRTKILDFSDEFDALPTRDAINAKVDAYLESHEIDVPKVNIELSFVSLFDTEEYKDIAPLEYVDLCDTVHVDFDRLGVSATAKVISTRWDVLNERLEKIEIGEAHTSLATSITSEVEAQTTQAVGFLDQYVAGLTKTITNSLGLFSTRVTGTDGAVQYYLHNRPTLAESQYQWTINSGGFAVSQDYGQTWSAGIDSEGNAVFNSLSANVVRAMEIYGSYIEGSRFVSENGNFDMALWAAVLTLTASDYIRSCLYATNNTGNLVLMSGTSTDANTDPTDGTSLRIQSNEIKFRGNGNSANDFVMTYSKDSGKMSVTALKSIDIRCGTVHILLDATNGLGVWFNGQGYNGLGFVNDGNGHSVIGK